MNLGYKVCYGAKHSKLLFQEHYERYKEMGEQVAKPFFQGHYERYKETGRGGSQTILSGTFWDAIKRLSEQVVKFIFKQIHQDKIRLINFI